VGVFSYFVGADGTRTSSPLRQFSSFSHGDAFAEGALMSTNAKAVSEHEPGQGRDARNAARFYAAFESWLSEHGPTMRELGGETVLTPFTFHAAGRSLEKKGKANHRGSNPQGQVALAPSHAAGRGCVAAARSNRSRRRVKDADERARNALAT
jgi:hypothetical protein